MLGLFYCARSSFHPEAAWSVDVCRRIGSLFLVALAVFVVGGCSRKAAAVPSSAPIVADTPAAAAPGPMPATQPPVNLTQPDGQVDLPELQRSVLRWVLANHRRPKNFEDFAATAGIQIPPPPSGKKYNLSKDLHVQLIAR